MGMRIDDGLKKRQCMFLDLHVKIIEPCRCIAKALLHKSDSGSVNAVCHYA
jgi:hypothetical protein